MLKYRTVPITMYAQNCTVVWCDKTQAAAVIDPGGELHKIKEVIAGLGVVMEQIWITHGHIDHAASAASLAQELNVPIYGPHEDDLFLLEMLGLQGKGTPGFRHAQSFVPDRWLRDLDKLHIGQEVFLVRHCPGHTPGHVVFYCEQAHRAFVGDVLFAGSIGRTDFPRGDHAQLMSSIVQKLWPMGDETVFISGHGSESTFGRERQTNPFVAGT